jgi:membrane-associated phospholipid phosphatase
LKWVSEFALALAMLRAALLFLALSISTPAFADTGATPDAPPGAGTGSDVGVAPGDKPTIAPPAPEASPEKVEDAKKVADKAKLTPIIPNPNNPTQPAFQLYAEIDVPILAVGTVFALSRLIKQQPAYCAPECTETTAPLNALDKLTKGYYSTAWSTASDFELYGLGAAAAILLVSDEGLVSTLNDAVVIGEATLGATAVANIMTLAAGRPRPFLYSETAPLSVRNSADAGLSFLSSHTAEAFALVTSLYVAEKRLHPSTSNNRRLELGIGLTVASFIGFSRVMSGYHFITDAVGGAVVGSSLGILIASVHGSPVHIVPVTDPTTRTTGVGITGTF